MKIIIKSTLIFFLIFSANQNTIAAETEEKLLGDVQVNSIGTLYIRPVDNGSWGGNDCPNARYAQIALGEPAYDQTFSFALAAKMSQSEMHFRGSCSLDGNYFHINYSFLH